jgi:hypothetical protein
MKKFSILFCLFLIGLSPIFGQVQDTVVAEEDFSQYENIGFADQGAKRYASPKILDLSPQRLISISWDQQMAHNFSFSRFGEFSENENAPISESGTFSAVSGLRLFANIPIISRNSLVWQGGINYANSDYVRKDLKLGDAWSSTLSDRLDANGLRTAGVHTTIFKPLNEKQFLIFQGAADLSGDYGWDLQPASTIRYSGAVIWGKRTSDRKIWGVGLSRGYRVGELNYIPVFLLNWTSPNRKWGTEILLPARANIRRTINSRNLILAGFELEGQSYRTNVVEFNDLGVRSVPIELRRGEARAKVEYQRRLFGFIWASATVGYRHNWSFNADYTSVEGVKNGDFFRGFTGNQKYAMLNTLSNPLFFNIGIHLVSP